MDKQFDSSKFNDQPGFKNLESSEKEAWEIMETAKEIKKPSRKGWFFAVAIQ